MLAHEPHSQNPLYLFCGRVPDLGEPCYIFAKTTVPVCLPMSLIHKIHYIYFVVVCLILGAQLYICLNHCACVLAQEPHSQSSLYLFCGRVLNLEEPHYVFAKTTVPGCLVHQPPWTKSGISLLRSRA